MAKGGARKGAGRKPSTIKGMVKRLPGDVAALILDKINANQKWVDLANSKDEKVVLETLKYLSNRAYGMPKQSMEHDGKDGKPIAFTVTHIAGNQTST